MRVRDSYTVTEIIEGGGLSRPILNIIGLCFLLMICDSYDLSSLSYAAPSLIREWGLRSSSMGFLFSAGMLGLLVGSLVFGRLGDYFGRKRAMILGVLSFGVLTAATGFAESENQLFILRLLATLGLGGAIPNAVALITESVPAALRFTAVGAIYVGYSGGGVIAGVIAVYIIPVFGWQMVFFIGGFLSLVTAIAFAQFLPESLRYLVTQPSKKEETARVAAYLRPDLHFDAHVNVVSDVANNAGTGWLADLFGGSLKVATPMMWLIYVASSTTVFSLVSWMPVAAERIGHSHSAAAVATALLYAGSAAGGILGGRLSDKYGLVAIVAMAAIAFPAVAGIGMLRSADSFLYLVSFFAGCFACGVQTCLHGIVGSLYPTHIRANGTGLAMGIAKIGSILGPFLGGLLLPGLTSRQIFLSAASPLVLVALLAFVLRVLLLSSSDANIGERVTEPIDGAPFSDR